ncbi:hypothetical protein FPOAC1_006158 [Fusarium poae]|nr:hypothetical protein FPOAC1_006158 [Fusarium poae]KAG8672863.1 hypothetical protein FPOAC1_006158 [Fusarium poae]
MARLILVYAVLSFWVALAVAQYDYNNLLKGCYQGQSDDFTVGGLASTQPQRERCALVCSQRGNNFVAFGIYNCFCAKSEPAGTNKVDISRCKAQGLDGWNAPKLRKVNRIEDVFVVFNIDPKRQSDDLESTPQDEVKPSQSGSPAALSHSAGRSRPLGCYPGLPLDVDLNTITITEKDRRQCAKACGEKGKAAVVFSGLKCGCTDNPPKASTRVEDIRCALQSTNELYRTDLVYSVWSSGFGVNLEGYIPKVKDYPYKPSEVSTDRSELIHVSGPGCYRSPPTPKNRRYKNLESNCPETCRRFCKEYKKRYMFLQQSDCWCSDEPPSEMEELNRDRCDIRCYADQLSMCGGEYSYSVYDLGTQTRPASLSEKSTGQCFSSRALTSRQVMGISNQEDFLEACINRCKDIGEPLALVHDSKCWCATTYPHDLYSSSPESCNLPCQGDNENHCGGTQDQKLYYSLYTTSVRDGVQKDPRGRPFDFPKRHETTWHGCWREPPRTEHHSHSSHTNTVTSCASYCRRYRSTVAAVRQNSCVCATSYPEHSQRRPDSMCKSSCPGYPYDDCGGPQAWTVVNTGLINHVPYDKPRRKEAGNDNTLNTGSKKALRLGCYDTRSDTWGAVQAYIGNAGPEVCASRCRNMKFPVSAMQGKTCSCGVKIPRRDSRVNGFHCNLSCRDEGSCGGVSTWSIFNSGLQASVQTDANTKPAHGCFKFTRPISTRLIPQVRYVDIFSPNQSRNRGSCTARCAEEGYPVALRHGTKCFCSPGLPQERVRVEDQLCSYQCRGDKLEACGGPSYAYTVYKTDAYMPDLQNEEKLKSKLKPEGKKPKEEIQNPSPDGRHQCLHPALEKANEVFNVVSEKLTAVTLKIQVWFFWIRDKAQHIFDTCLWNVMVFFSNILYRLGFLSAEGAVEL